MFQFITPIICTLIKNSSVKIILLLIALSSNRFDVINNKHELVINSVIIIIMCCLFFTLNFIEKLANETLEVRKEL